MLGSCSKSLCHTHGLKICWDDSTWSVLSHFWPFFDWMKNGFQEKLWASSWSVVSVRRGLMLREDLSWRGLFPTGISSGSSPSICDSDLSFPNTLSPIVSSIGNGSTTDPSAMPVEVSSVVAWEVFSSSGIKAEVFQCSIWNICKRGGGWD